jgi:hypothetical protein
VTDAGGTPSNPPDFVTRLFGYRVARDGSVTTLPNSADSNNRPSIAIARDIMEALGVPVGTRGLTDPGSALEDGMAQWLATRLPVLAPDRAWDVQRGRVVTFFTQYAHLSRLQALIDEDPTQTLKAEIGSDYLVRPDVTVGLSVSDGEMLHASVSCKWTIRSDRVQNIRHEAVILTRHRRGRQPHIVAVTAEPLPTRLAAIARGTGEVDGVYHVALPLLDEAVARHGTAEQKDVLKELVDHRRLFDLNALPAVLAE